FGTTQISILEREDRVRAIPQLRFLEKHKDRARPLTISLDQGTHRACSGGLASFRSHLGITEMCFK
ncbi:MAG TPA: hypothetical protein VFV38_02940, partial [Ktedonobacteraceae bacterium]|nr:hypothetical protein [Ktedonobacteraceae bacterium]